MIFRKRIEGDRVRVLTLSAALLAAAVIVAVGCSSESVNSVGQDLVGPGIDTLLVALDLDELSAFGNLVVEDEDRPYDEMQLLYLGNRDGARSSVLLRYDFAAFAAEHGDTLPEVSLANIDTLYLRFYFVDNLDKPVKSVVIEELAEPLDPSLYPGAPPAVVAGDPLATSESFQTDNAFSVPISIPRFLEWWQDGTHNGLMVRDISADEIAGLVAVASKENGFASSQFGQVYESYGFGPALRIIFKEPAEGGTNISYDLLPVDDVGTWESLDPIPTDPTDGFALRTHLRSYPYLSFDLSELPDNVVINRAELWVGLDTLSSHGPIESLVVSEIDSSFAATAGGIIQLDDLDDEARGVAGRTGIDVNSGENRRIYFNVTTSCQRLVNGLFDETFRFLLTAGEDCFRTWDAASTDPDFSLVRFDFEGTSADPDLRPHLQILYSGVDELSGGAK